MSVKRACEFALVLGVFLVLAGPVFSHPWYTGYSSAPGCSGTCASMCHGSSGGMITVTGFPSSYTPGQVYPVEINHNGGDPIQNFNGSCRVGTGSTNAGTIAADLNTATYNVTGETNGVHFSSYPNDSGEFLWTAPAGGTGTVTLYIAGHQGASAGGPNSTVVLTSTELVGIEGEGSPFSAGIDFGLRLASTNPGSGGVALAYGTAPSGAGRLGVYDVTGRLVRYFTLGGGASGILRWDGRDGTGRLLPQGVYLFQLKQGTRTSAVRALLVR